MKQEARICGCTSILYEHLVFGLYLSILYEHLVLASCTEHLYLTCFQAVRTLSLSTLTKAGVQGIEIKLLYWNEVSVDKCQK